MFWVNATPMTTLWPWTAKRCSTARAWKSSAPTPSRAAAGWAANPLPQTPTKFPPSKNSCAGPDREFPRRRRRPIQPNRDGAHHRPGTRGRLSPYRQRQPQGRGRHHATTPPRLVVRHFPRWTRRSSSRPVNLTAAASKPAASSPSTPQRKQWLSIRRTSRPADPLPGQRQAFRPTDRHRIPAHLPPSQGAGTCRAAAS